MVSEGDISKPKCCKSLIRVQSWPGERRLSGLPLLGAVSCAHLLSPASRWLRHGGAKHRGGPAGTVAAWASGKIPAKDWLRPKNLHLVFLLCITLKLCPALDRGRTLREGLSCWIHQVCAASWRICTCDPWQPENILYFALLYVHRPPGTQVSQWTWINQPGCSPSFGPCRGHYIPGDVFSPV